MASGIRLTDLELLSAYLDDELSSRERAALEARLAVEPALRTELEALRRTVAVLHAAPEVTPPRSFVLDPALYRRRPPWWLRYGAFRLAGALGAAGAILLLAFGLALLSNPARLGAPQGVAYLATQSPSDTLALKKATASALPAITSDLEGRTESAAESTAALPTMTLPASRTSAPIMAFAATESPTAATQLNQVNAPTELPPSEAPRDKGSLTTLAAVPPGVSPILPTQEALGVGGAPTSVAGNLAAATLVPAPISGGRADETAAPEVPAPTGGDGAGLMMAPTATYRALEQPAQPGAAKSGPSLDSQGASTPTVTSVPTATPTLAPTESPAPTRVPGLAARPTKATLPPLSTSTSVSASVLLPTGTLVPTGTPTSTGTSAPTLTLVPPTGTPVPPTDTPIPGLTRTPVPLEPTSLDPAARLLLVGGLALLIISLLIFAIGWARSRL